GDDAFALIHWRRAALDHDVCHQLVVLPRPDLDDGAFHELPRRLESHKAGTPTLRLRLTGALLPVARLEFGGTVDRVHEVCSFCALSAVLAAARAPCLLAPGGLSRGASCWPLSCSAEPFAPPAPVAAGRLFDLTHVR